MQQDLDLVSLNQWLNGFMNFERRPDKNMLNLSTMAILCEYFGHPELSRPCFHVAGSKGKGTISADIAAILRTSGFITGVFSSPHVSHFTERIGTGTGPFPPAVYEEAEKELRTGVEQLINSGRIKKETITWFELVTTFAMLVFREANVDYAIYEVGMGGRLDCTNVVQPVAVAMGPIELEHTEYLGDTLAKIATEKAGTFKDKVPVISAPQAPEVIETFNQIAASHATSVDYVPSAPDYNEVNAEIAYRAVKVLLPDLKKEVAIEAAASVKLPGRYELRYSLKNYPNIPYLLLDVAHTKNSVQAVLNRIAKNHVSGLLLFGCAADKDVESMATEIKNSNLFSHIYLTRPGDFKKSDLPRMEQAFAGQPVTSNPDYKALIREALEEASITGTPLIAFGSFYLIDEIIKILEA